MRHAAEGRWFKVEQMSVILGCEEPCVIIIYRVTQSDPEYCPAGKIVVRLFHGNHRSNKFFANEWARMHKCGCYWGVSSIEGVLKCEWKTPSFIRATKRGDESLSVVLEVGHG